MPTVQDQHREHTDRLTASPEALADVRERVRSLLIDWDLPEFTEDAVLCATELVTNVHRHVQDKQCEVRLLAQRDEVILEVSDRSKAAPILKLVSDEAESGRGIQLIHALATKWTWVPTYHGKKIVCVFRAAAA